MRPILHKAIESLHTCVYLLDTYQYLQEGSQSLNGGSFRFHFNFNFLKQKILSEVRVKEEDHSKSQSSLIWNLNAIYAPEC